MNRTAMKHRWIRIAVVTAGWLLLGFVLAIEVHFNNRAGAALGAVDFVDVAVPQFVRALMWALLAPLILRLREKMPLRRGGWVGGIGFHLAMSFVVMATFYLGRMVAYHLFFERMDGSFWETVLSRFYGRNLIDMGYYWAVLGVGYSLETYQRFKNEELKAAQLEARLVETELKALREQLRPHFLFNTLNTIAVLVRENKNDAAVTLIAQLSSLLRMSLDSSRGHEVTVRQEMEFLTRYIEIQKARFSDRLSVALAIEPAALEARIPTLLLQPLVENAIVHGIAAKTGPGRVDVVGRVAEGRLHLEVRDDGPGLAPGPRPGRQGIGLSNTRERLAKIYGADGRMTLVSEPGLGVSVQIVIPCRS